jgi:L-2-hydroxyglutarate oxidase
MGVRPEVQIIPFRGEYYTLRRGQDRVRGLVYPVPDPEFPFLGVHFTKRIQGDVEAGPNAVLAFAREGYRRTSINPVEMLRTLTYRGFWAMAAKYWRTGIYEMYRSVSKRAFLHALQRLVPELEESDLEPGGAGVRAQAVARDGSLVDDFKISETPNAIHVLNAPSPAATASLAIGGHIAELAGESFGL